MLPKEQEALIAGLSALGLPQSQDKVDLLIKFVALIQKWNKTYNLTAIDNPLDIITLHILDSLAIIPHLKHGKIADIGTGAGLPGIPLAIYAPENEYVLIDSNAKKTRFVQQVLLELKLKNISVLHARVDQYQPDQRFDRVICRAFASVSEIQNMTAHLINDQGEILAMKGDPTHQELSEIIGPYVVIPLQVPGIEAKRCLIRMQAQNT